MHTTHHVSVARRNSSKRKELAENTSNTTFLVTGDNCGGMELSLFSAEMVLLLSRLGFDIVRKMVRY
jgi:2',3'-cyclic-nucleotide 2'-phosphodiesterase (5'-nucleotidase family)